MLFFLLPLALLAILAVLAVAIAVAVFRAVRSVLSLRRAEFQITPDVIRPGEGMRVWARVLASGTEPLAVRAALTCTMLDHRPRRLYENAHALIPVHDRPGEHAVFMAMPSYALRSGAVGDELSRLFSEDAHRLLISWSVDFEVVRANRPGVVLARTSIPVEVPEGQPLQADRAYMDQLIVATCQSMHSDLVFNWMVRLASADGAIDPTERQLLHEVLAASFGVTDVELADARIAVEMQRDLQVDPVVLRKHLPEEAMLSLYRFLYAMAWRDGQLDGREHNFLVDVLEKFGLDAGTVQHVEREVVEGMARHAQR
ncbi:MAG: TerB family tellurite resistance protein [Byssovorax sp.]